MLSKIFFTRFKCLLRTKENIFWNILFPIIVSSLIYFTFSNVYSNKMMELIPIAIVNENVSAENEVVTEVLESLSKGEDAVFSLTNVSLEKAKDLLKNEDIVAYIDLSNSNLVVNKSGYEQTVVKSVLDFINQRYSTIGNIMALNNGQIDEVTLNKMISSETVFVAKKATTNNDPDTIIIYFYAILAMTCLYGAMAGIDEVGLLQANQSMKAARVACSPYPKLKYFFGSVSATILLQTIQTTIVLLFLVFGLKINFGDQINFIILANFVGSIVGVFFGTFLGAVIKGNERLKTGISVAVIMLLSFMAGLMSTDIKYYIDLKAPIINKINPVGVLSNCYYSLYYYNDLNRFYGYLGILGIIAVLLFTATFVLIRRRQYESI